MGLRVRRFEKKLEERKESDFSRESWEKMRRGREGKVRSSWEKKKRLF